MKDFKPYEEEEFKIAEKAAEIINNAAAIPCTGCGYCTVTCPKNIPIPNYFALFQSGHFTTQVVYYFNIIQNHPRASECIECRQCEAHCPQHIEITKHLKEVSKSFDGFKGYR